MPLEQFLCVFVTHDTSATLELLAVLQEVLDQHNLYVCSRDERAHLNVFGVTASACSERARDLSCF